MKNKKLNFFCLFLIITFFTTLLKSDEVNKLIDPHEYNFFTGMFDFSDEGKRAHAFRP